MKPFVPSIPPVAAITMQAGHAYTIQLQVRGSANKPVHKITGNVERATKAVNYGKRTGLTNMDVRGTAL